MTTHDTAAALWSAIRYAAGDFIRDGDEQAIDRAITAHVEAEVALRLAAAPDVEAAIVDYALAAQGDFDTSEERDALRAAIAADKARAVAAAIEGTGRAEQFADAICHRVGARDSGCGGQTVEAGTARLYADAAKRIDDLIARDKARPTPDEARSIGRVAEHLRGLAAEVEPSRMADGFEADRMRLLAHRLRQVAALMPDSDEALRLVDALEEAAQRRWMCNDEDGPAAVALLRRLAADCDDARTALLRALGVES